jgi:hypothetical protein
VYPRNLQKWRSRENCVFLCCIFNSIFLKTKRVWGNGNKLGRSQQGLFVQIFFCVFVNSYSLDTYNKGSLVLCLALGERDSSFYGREEKGPEGSGDLLLLWISQSPSAQNIQNAILWVIMFRVLTLLLPRKSLTKFLTSTFSSKW